MTEIAYIRLIVLLHAAFAGVFYFMDRQHPTKFARYLALSWTIEAVRALIRLQNVNVPDVVSYDWFALSDVLQVFANWCLLVACADLAGVRLPPRLGWWFVWVSLPLLVINRYLTPRVLLELGVAAERSTFFGVFFNQVLLFGPAALIRLTILGWLFKIWQTTRLPGALIATIFCVPYAVLAIAYPFQYYYGYDPDWVTALWLVRVLGFSVGLVMLLLDQQLTALQKSEARLATAQTNAKLGSWEYDIRAGTGVWSAELYRLVGRESSLGPPSVAELLALIHPDDRAAFERLYAPSLQVDHQLRGEYRLIRPNRGVMWVEARSDVVRDAAGKRTRLTGTLQDITDKKQFEEQFLRAQRMENIGLLAAGIAHDFNNILTPVLMAAPMLRENVADSDRRKLLAAVEQSAERGAALVGQILAFAHGTGGSRALVHPHHILRELASMITETFPRDLRLEQRIAPDPWPVIANPTQLHQVLLNLCVNARDAMPAGGVLRLGLANCALDAAGAVAIPGGRAGNFVLIEVSDTGGGIRPEILAHIWEPFFTTKSPNKGTGLGLSTVRGIVSSHDGFCSVQSAPDTGTTFRVYLPAAETGQVAEPGSAHPFAHPGQDELLLVVDDEVNVREFACSTLARHGYHVLPAADGLEGAALFTLRQDEIRLVITDIHMPNLAGESLAQHVRRLKPATPLLVISGLVGVGDESARNFGDAFLLKPFKPDALLVAVHKLLHREPVPPA